MLLSLFTFRTKIQGAVGQVTSTMLLTLTLPRAHTLTLLLLLDETVGSWKGRTSRLFFLFDLLGSGRCTACASVKCECVRSR